MRHALISATRADFAWKPRIVPIPAGHVLFWLGLAITLKDIG